MNHEQKPALKHRLSVDVTFSNPLKLSSAICALELVLSRFEISNNPVIASTPDLYTDKIEVNQQEET